MDLTKHARIELCYYITGHGLGHATRSLELIRILLASNCFNVHIVTQVKEDFFKQNLDSVLYSERVSHYLRSLDTGAVQRDVFVVDAVETLVKYHDNIHQHRQQLIDFELKWLRDANIKLVMVDATPLGCLVGSLVGAVTILVSNFSWDFCFKQMLQKLTSANVFTTEQVQSYNNMVNCCELDSSACSFYLQLPGATPLPACFDSSRLVTGPLIARGLQNSNLRASLSIDDNAQVLLLGFGGHSAEWRLEDTFLPPGWVCLVLGAQDKDMPSARFRALPQDAYVPDYIHMAQAVLGKLGYGFVSECLAMGTALIYVPRQDWPEERYLEILLTDTYQAGVCMQQADFVAGHWESLLLRAAALKGTWAAPSTEEAAQSVLSFIMSKISQQ